MRVGTSAVAAVALIAGLGVASPSFASERRFTYSTESSVLAPGEREFEPWTTYRARRDGFYSRFDERLEFEVGLTERLQTAVYLNFTALARDVGEARESSLSFGGVSSEWKYKLLDPVADALGAALYFEATGSPDELELEGKLIFDKRFGNFLGAFNLVGEREWGFERGETEAETKLVVSAGFGYFLTSALFAGVELRNHNEILPEEGWAHSVLSAGPTVSYSASAWWASLTVLPQVAALRGATHDGLNLDEHEKFEARVLFGWHL